MRVGWGGGLLCAATYIGNTFELHASQKGMAVRSYQGKPFLTEDCNLMKRRRSACQVLHALLTTEASIASCILGTEHIHLRIALHKKILQQVILPVSTIPPSASSCKASYIFLSRLIAVLFCSLRRQQCKMGVWMTIALHPLPRLLHRPPPPHAPQTSA